MSIQRISPEHARDLLESGALLFDIRETDEHARERIPAARNVPLAAVAQSSLQADGTRKLIFHCKSGARTGANAMRLAAAAGCDAYILEGGLDAWKHAGLPVLTDRTQPLEIMRQVQIVAGGLVLLGVVLGSTLQPAFYGLAAFVGAGLLFSGLTGTCAMASILRRMPWNRRVI
jgi:rhodanese-related sulfurtransferase